MDTQTLTTEPIAAPRLQDSAISIDVLSAVDRLQSYLLIAIGVLVASHWVGYALVKGIGINSYQIDRLTDLNTEGNPAAWFSSLQLAIAGLLAAARWAVERQAQSWRRRDRGWLILSAVLIMLSLDEAAALHETMLVPARWLAAQQNQVVVWATVLGGVLPALCLCAILGRFYLRLQPATQAGMARAAAVFFGGAVGVDLLGGVVYELGNWGEILHPVFVTAEEAMEMLGVWMMIGLLGRSFGDLRITALARQFAPRAVSAQ